MKVVSVLKNEKERSFDDVEGACGNPQAPICIDVLKGIYQIHDLGKN